MTTDNSGDGGGEHPPLPGANLADEPPDDELDVDVDFDFDPEIELVDAVTREKGPLEG